MRIPEAGERVLINDGYCLWLGSDINKSTKLLRNNVEVVHAPDIFLKRDQKYHVRFEKIDQTIHFYLNGLLQFSYIAYLPLIGTHIGLLSRDWDFELSDLNISVGSLSVLVNCLSVPDTFLALKDYHKALSEYRRIAYSFSGRAEGREALFRAGITLIEEARESPDKAQLLELALKEFEKLHGTPGAPLEYLGKALVYQELNETEEEIKCYELAYRRYGKHPLLPILQEQIIARMHGVSRYDRVATYQFVLLCARHLPLSAMGAHTRRLFTSLQRHWEPLYFILDHFSDAKSKKEHDISLTIQLAFWLAKPYILEEILTALQQRPELPLTWISNGIFSLLELGCGTLAQQIWDGVKERVDPSQHKMVELALACKKYSVESSLSAFFVDPKYTLTPEELRTLIYLLEQALDSGKTDLILRSVAQLVHCELSFDSSLALNTYQISAYLQEKNWKRAGELIETYPLELLELRRPPHSIFCMDASSRQPGKRSPSSTSLGFSMCPYPRSWALLSPLPQWQDRPQRPLVSEGFPVGEAAAISPTSSLPTVLAMRPSPPTSTPSNNSNMWFSIKKR